MRKMQGQTRHAGSQGSDYEGQGRQDPVGHEGRLPEMRHDHVPYHGCQKGRIIGQISSVRVKARANQKFRFSAEFLIIDGCSGSYYNYVI